MKAGKNKNKDVEVTKVEEWLHCLNHSELVALCRSKYGYVDTTYSNQELINMLLSNNSELQGSDLYEMRRRLTDYLLSHDLIIDPDICPKNCFEHSDFFVLHCFLANKDLLKGGQT